MTATAYRHIELDSDGVAHIAGTRTKVIEVAVEWLAYHWDAEEIARQHPDLSLGQVHSALAYYHDHREELDRELEQRMRAADAFFAQLGHSALRSKLIAARHER